MKSLLASVLASIIVLASSVSQAAVPLSPATADALLQKSGLANQLTQIEPSVQAGLNQNPALAGKLTEGQLDSLRSAFSTAYASEHLTAEARTQLTTALSPENARQALVWLDSDLGRHITALEDEAGKFEGMSERETAAAERFKTLPQRRIERYEQLAKATKAGEGGAAVTIDTALATARGVASVASDGSEQNLDKIRAQFEAHRAQMEQSVEQEFIVLFAGAYETLEDRELDQYIAFAQSPAGSAYNSALIKVLDAVMSKAGLETGKLLGAAREASKKDGP